MKQLQTQSARVYKTSQGHDRNIFKIITSPPRRKILYFPFHRLLGELRNTVYKHALTTPETIDVMRYYRAMTECTRYKPEPPPLSLTVKLLCTNKQINEQGTGILYEHNTFGFRLEYYFSGRFSSHVSRSTFQPKIIQVPQEHTKTVYTKTGII